jgi:hypothetical protein
VDLGQERKEEGFGFHSNQTETLTLIEKKERRGFEFDSDYPKEP